MIKMSSKLMSKPQARFLEEKEPDPLVNPDKIQASYYTLKDWWLTDYQDKLLE